MIALAIDGVTSLSTRPLRAITMMGLIVSCFSFIFIVWVMIGYLGGHTILGWASLISALCFIGGIQLICIGIIGEYVGKIYLEVKSRPRFIISDRTTHDKTS